MQWSFRFVFFMFFIVMLGCSTPPPPPALRIEEQILADNRTLATYQERVEAGLKRRKPSALIQTYLEQLSKKLISSHSEYRGVVFKVELHDASSALKGSFLSFPGSVIWVPIQYLKECEYENELASAIAYQMSLVIQRVLAKNYDPQSGTSNLEQLTRGERAEVIRSTVELLYQAGFDPRGVGEFLKRFHEDYRVNRLSSLEIELDLKEAQRARSFMVPLRHPVVRSDAFLLMKKEVQSWGLGQSSITK